MYPPIRGMEAFQRNDCSGGLGHLIKGVQRSVVSQCDPRATAYACFRGGAAGDDIDEEHIATQPVVFLPINLSVASLIT
jgi:hypothetical protein